MPAPTTLADLIDKAATKHDVRYVTDLARIAQRAGYEVVHTTLNQIRAGTYQHSPSRKTLEAVAYLAGVSYETAYEAAGLGKARKSFAAQLPPDVDRLSAKSRRVLLALIREMIEIQSAAEAELRELREDSASRPEGGVSGATLGELGFPESDENAGRGSEN